MSSPKPAAKVADAKDETVKYLQECGLSREQLNPVLNEMCALRPKNPQLYLRDHFDNLAKVEALQKAIAVNLSTAMSNKLEELKVTFKQTIPKFQSSDILMVIDMQHDFVPADSFIEGCGAFAVAKGEKVSIEIAKLIRKASAVGCTIVASRDYHPSDHCSFNNATPVPGPYPPHCVQGSPGSFFVTPVKDALMEARKANPSKVLIAFKGYHSNIDSYGALPYVRSYGEGRISEKKDGFSGACSLDWTGGAVFNCSYQNADLDAPPDVMAVFDKSNVSLDKILSDRKRRVFVCGLAMDFCVTDTAINARTMNPPFEEVYIIHDATSAAFIPGFGQYLGGYLSNPETMANLFRKHDISMVSKDLL